MQVNVVWALALNAMSKKVPNGLAFRGSTQEKPPSEIFRFG
jgi:hypothetical protein